MEHVRKGAELLDEQRPGWHRRINLNMLDVGSPTRCVLGQCYGGYYKGLAKLGLESGHTHGFVGPIYLNKEWRQEILARRHANAVCERENLEELVPA